MACEHSEGGRGTIPRHHKVRLGALQLSYLLKLNHTAVTSIHDRAYTREKRGEIRISDCNFSRADKKLFTKTLFPSLAPSLPFKDNPSYHGIP